MTDMPQIVTHLTGDVSGLARAVAEGETLVDKYGENVEKKTREHGERAGEAGGKGLTDKLEEELGRPTVAERPLAGISKRVEEKFKEIGEKAGKDFTGSIETEVKTLETKLQSLADDMMRSGNFDLMKEFKSTQGDLGILSRVKKEFEQVKTESEKMGGDVGSSSKGWFSNLTGMFSNLTGIAAKAGSDAGSEAGKTFTSGLQGWMSTPVLGPITGGALVAAIIASAPAIGAALDSVFLLAVGGGALAVGIVAAIQDARVKGAWSGTISDIKRQFIDASSPLMQPLIDGASKFGALFDRMLPGIQAGMGKLAPILDQLLTGFVDMIDRIGPGFSQAFEASLPFLSQMAADLPLLGQGISDFLGLIASGGGGATSFFHDLIVLVDVFLVELGATIAFLSNTYGVLSGAAKIMSGDLSGAKDIAAVFGDTTKKGFDKTAEGAAHATAEIDKTKKSLSDFISEAFRMQDSQLALQKGLFDVAKAFEQNGASLDIHTEKGLANREALQHQIETIARWRQEQLDAGKAPAYVNSEIDKQIKLMYDDARAHGANVAQLDALIGQWRTILNLPAYKSFTTDMITNRIDNGGVVPGSGGRRVQRWGGIVQHAADGMVTKPGIYQGRGDGFTVMAERETKKEGYFPQNISGPHGYELLSEMASWKGWSIDTGGGGRGGGHDGASAPTGGGGSSQPLTVQLIVDGRVFYEQVVLPQQRQFLNNNGFSGGG